MIESGLSSIDSILKLCEIGSILIGGGLVFFRLGETTSKMEAAMKAQASEISELKEDVKVVSRLLTDVAVQDQRLNTIDKRLEVLDRRYEDLRHGRGFVTEHPSAL